MREMGSEGDGEEMGSKRVGMREMGSEGDGSEGDGERGR